MRHVFRLVFWQNYIDKPAVASKQRPSGISLSVAHTGCPPSLLPGGKSKALLGGLSLVVLAAISGGFSSALWGAA